MTNSGKNFLEGLGEGKRRSKRSRKSRIRILKKMLPFLMYVAVLIHFVIDKIIDFLFSLYYDDSKKKTLPPVKNELLLESAISLAAKIRNKEVSSEDVVRCFAERIKEVNPIINAIIEERFEDAIKEAKEVDRILASGDVGDIRDTKPFLGVPFTTKDSTACKGMLQTMGLVSRKNERATDDADLVTLLKNAGGILLAVTSVPEINMWCETRNNIIGQTNNPYDTRRSAGGSSGGEASLIASAGSPLGIGSDIGGSIRIPAFCCGIFGHKTSTGITPLKGLTFRRGDEHPTMVSAGPMTKHACDLTPFLKVLLGTKVSRLKLDTKVNLKDVKVMFLEDMGDIRSSSMAEDMKIALQKAVTHFEEIQSKPAEKVTFDLMKHGTLLYRYWITKEQPNFAKDLANREGAVSPYTEIPKKLIGCSNFTLAALMRLADYELPRVNSKWAEKITMELQEQVYEKIERNCILLVPSQPLTAGYHYTSLMRLFNFIYCGIFNVLHMPVTQVPMGLNEHGVPVGVQVVAAPYNDHLCIAAAAELEKAFGGWVPPFPTKA